MRKASAIGLALACLAASFSLYGCGGNGSDSDSELVSVFAISRHGIRSPTSDSINLYTQRAEGFPAWPAPANTPGNLSTKGQDNATKLGSWYRDYYSQQGVLPAKGSCPAAGAVYVYADVMERTIHTAQGYIDGMFQADSTPGCGLEVVHLSGRADPYIDTAVSGICKIDSAQDMAAFNAAVGGSVENLVSTYADELQTLQRVTQCCQPQACGESTGGASCTLMDLPNEVSVNPLTGAVGFVDGALFDIADFITETFELEYAQGMPEKDCASTQGAQCVAWGELSESEMSHLTKLHVMDMDLSCRLPSFAQVGSSNLMWQLVGTMDQTLSGVKNADVLAPVQSKFTLFVAHDENVAAIAGFLGGVNWNVDGFQKNDPDPAGALVFELHRAKDSGELFVKLFYVSASLEQMRDGTVLSLEQSPQRIQLEIPACGGYDCSYDELKTFINSHVRQDCLVKKS